MNIKKIAYNGALGDTICLAYVINFLKKINYYDEVEVYCNFPEIFEGLCKTKRLHKVKLQKEMKKKSNFKNKTIYKFTRDFIHLLKFRLLGIKYVSWTKTYVNRSSPLNEIFLKTLCPNIDLNKFYEFDFDPWLQTNLLEAKKNRILIAPEAGWRCRELPFETTQSILRKNNLMEDDILVIGSKKTLDNYNSMNDHRGDFNLKQLINEVIHAKLIITSDSGIFHLASILKKETIAVFGPVYPNLRQYPHNNSKIYFRYDLLCTGCSTRLDISKYNGNCPLGHNKCMEF